MNSDFSNNCFILDGRDSVKIIKALKGDGLYQAQEQKAGWNQLNGGIHGSATNDEATEVVSTVFRFVLCQSYLVTDESVLLVTVYSTVVTVKR